MKLFVLAIIFSIYTQLVSAQTKHTADYYFHKGAAYLVMPGERSDSLAKIAIGWYTKAIASNHRYWYAYRNRAALYSFLHLYKKQVADLKLAIKYSSKTERPYFFSFLGIAYYNDGNFTDAVKSIDLAVRRQSNSAYLYLYRAKCYWKLGLKDTACRDYSLAVKQDSILSKEKEFLICQ